MSDAEARPGAGGAGRAPGEPCPACGAPLRAWRTMPSGEPTLPAPVALLRCAGCGCAVTAGRAPAFAAVHERGAYAARTPRASRAAAPLLRRFDRRRLALLPAAGPRADGGRPVLLDVGAGRGRFVASARTAGWEARGLEPARRGVLAAREAYGVRLEEVGIDDADVAAATLDAACAWHVLEHLDDPADALARIGGWLRPGGVLLVGVPNRASWQARLGGPRWFHLDLPRHRVHLTPGALERLLRDAGLEPVRTTHVLAEHNPFGMWQSLVNRATGTTSHLFHVLRRAERPRPATLAATVALLPLLPVAAGLELLAGLARRGGTVAVLARRPEAGGRAR